LALCPVPHEAKSSWTVLEIPSFRFPYMTLFFYSMEMDELIEPNDTANWRERCGKLEPTALAPSKGLLLIEFNSGGN